MHRTRSITERFFNKIFIADLDGCWLWAGTIEHNGYGRIKGINKNMFAHRLSYNLFKGMIPDGLQIDHLCRNRRCVNPEHLEPVTSWENLMRGRSPAHRTQCPKGHKYTTDNTYWWERPNRKNPTRICRQCLHDRNMSRKKVPRL